MRISVFFIFLTIGNCLFAQKSALTKADKLFSMFSYQEAIDIYESLDENNQSIEVQRKLGNAYRNIGNNQKAEEYYAKIAVDNPNANDLYWYAQILLSNDKKEEALVWMDKYSEMKGVAKIPRFSVNDNILTSMEKENKEIVVKNLDINTANQEFSPTFYNDKIIYTSAKAKNSFIKRVWNWNNQPFLDIFEADKKKDGSLENPKRFLNNINNKFHEGAGTYCPAYKMMAFTRNNYDNVDDIGERNLMLYFSYENGDGTWSEPISFQYNNPRYSVGHPSFDQTGDTLYFVSDMPASIGGTDIFYSVRKDSVSWSAPKRIVGAVNTPGNEMFPFYRDNVLFFASDAHIGFGGLDLYYTNHHKGEFSMPENMGAKLNSPKDDFGLIIDESRKMGYFASNREGGKGDDDIYYFESKKLIVEEQIYQIEVLSETGEPILANISFKNPPLSDQSFRNVSNCNFLKAGGTLEILVEKEGYETLSTTYEYEDFGEDKKLALTLIKLKPVEPAFDVDAITLITDANSGKELKDVKITIDDRASRTLNGEYFTNKDGVWFDSLSHIKKGDVLDWKMRLEKKGYKSKDVEVKITCENNNVYFTHEYVNTKLTAFAAGSDIGEMFQLQPIYFDLDKDNIRPDAIATLEKLISILNEYDYLKIQIETGADCRGSDYYNKKLSERRYNSVMRYLKGKVKNFDRLSGFGLGESEAYNCCHSKHGCGEDMHQSFRIARFVIKE